MMRKAQFGDDEFVGYLFKGPPERRPRMWFLDRHVGSLLPLRDGVITGADLSVTIDMAWGGQWSGQIPDGAEEIAGLCIRYEGAGDPMVWQLTDLTIPHVTVDGRDDDVWRLGLWPD